MGTEKSVLNKIVINGRNLKRLLEEVDSEIGSGENGNFRYRLVGSRYGFADELGFWTSSRGLEGIGRIIDAIPKIEMNGFLGINAPLFSLIKTSMEDYSLRLAERAWYLESGLISTPLSLGERLFDDLQDELERRVHEIARRYEE